LLMTAKKYIIPALTLLALVLFVWLFQSIVVYLIIAVVLTLIGVPLRRALCKLRIGRVALPGSLASILTLFIFLGFILLFGYLFLPPVIDEITFLSQLNFYDVVNNILEQYPKLDKALKEVATEEQIRSTVSGQIHSFLSLNNISLVLNNVLGYTGATVGGLFSVLFITFFFLNDQRIISQIILLITPTEYEHSMKEILRTSKSMLSRYFSGLVIDMLIVTTLVTTLMWLFGVRNALVIGCLAGVMNIIPYIGPLITMGVAVFLGVCGCIEIGHYDMITGVITKIIFVLVGVNMLDGMVLQPFIFSNTVKAHPLEIFLVILMAGTIGGVLGMVAAIPVYTLIRIVAKEFLIHFKFFKKLTEKIPD